MDFKTFYRSLSAEDRARFAELAGTSAKYIDVHLMFRRKMPKAALMQGLADACAAFNAPISKADILAFFYRDEPAEQPATA